MDHEGPVVRLHEHTCSLGTGRVVGSGTAAMRALHTAARRLLHPLLTIVTLLIEEKKDRQSDKQKDSQSSSHPSFCESHSGNLQEVSVHPVPPEEAYVTVLLRQSSIALWSHTMLPTTSFLPF